MSLYFNIFKGETILVFCLNLFEYYIQTMGKQIVNEFQQ